MPYDKEKVYSALVLAKENIVFGLKTLKSDLSDKDATKEAFMKLEFEYKNLMSIVELLTREIDKNEKNIAEAEEIKRAYNSWMADKEIVVGLNRKMEEKLGEKNKEIAVLTQELADVNESYRKYKEEIERLKEITEHQKFVAKMRSGKSNAYRHDVQEAEVYRLFQSGIKKEELAEKFGVSVRTIERRINKAKKLQKEVEEENWKEMCQIHEEIGVNSMKYVDDRQVGETYYEMLERLEAEEEREWEQEVKLYRMQKKQEEEMDRILFGDSFKM